MSTKSKDDLRQELQYVTSVSENLRIIKEMETCFEESELGGDYLLVSTTFMSCDLNKVIFYAKKSLNIMTNHNDGTDRSCFILSSALRMLGYAYLHLRNYDESLSYLTRADENVRKLEHNASYYLNTALDIYKDLCSVERVMGRNKDVVVHAKKVLEIKEKMVKEGCLELGKANQEVCEAYFGAMDLEGGLPYCLKAQEIFKKCLGANSVEVAKVKRLLAVIYYKSGDYVKALAQNRVAASIFKKKDPRSPDVRVIETHCANMLISMGRYGEAVGVLRSVLEHTGADETERALTVFTMARALCYFEKFDEAKPYLIEARGRLEKKGLMDPVLVEEMSEMYEKMNDVDTAISMTKGLLAVPGLAQKHLEESSFRLFSLMAQYGKEEDEIPSMEGVVKKLKESLGPHHLTTMKVSHGLSVAYARLERYNRALEIEENVAKGLKGLPPSELGFMHEVSKHLSKLKERIAESPKTASSQSKDEGLSGKISKCDISGDGK